MPFTTANIAEERKLIQEIADANPEAKAALDEHRREYEFRKKLVLARQEAGLTQRELQNISRLDQYYSQTKHAIISMGDKNGKAFYNRRRIQRSFSIIETK